MPYLFPCRQRIVLMTGSPTSLFQWTYLKGAALWSLPCRSWCSACASGANAGAECCPLIYSVAGAQQRNMQGLPQLPAVRTLQPQSPRWPRCQQTRPLTWRMMWRDSLMWQRPPSMSWDRSCPPAGASKRGALYTKARRWNTPSAPGKVVDLAWQEEQACLHERRY